MTTSSKPIVAGTILALVAALGMSTSAVGASEECTYDEEYLLGQEWMFECGQGWDAPLVTAHDDVTGTPCLLVELVDPTTLWVRVPTACIDEDLGTAAAVMGTLYVWP